ncbi:hypothetical protein GCM10010176_097140 [Nonomuraea spiralis]|nr:hypothetical protein GCM10010176_097140 [Nonomuraea spiralis]
MPTVLADVPIDEQALVSGKPSPAAQRILAERQTEASERSPTRRGSEQPLTIAMTATYPSLS